ncbi:non-ribosomal peptide synthetase/type I polyketide synthase [Glycomyces sp. NRRL B-16210]|uniref:non-ribosomal peptide synthetase/type I polyketide synthase n=1 Tax=Glycomyces sp. NRRL B-16210 TaxID=1463821 RepID=UPI00105CB20F|nr:non-ribosomal peptide synthetase/type I polyketide synthase [Glycomyces sp. NRRL B-16210]
MTQSAVPMSSSQQGMYFDSHLRKAADYHVVLHLRIEPVESERFEHAVRTVTAEQPALRSAVHIDRAGVSYTVAESVAPPVVSHDLRGREQDADAIAAEAAATPFTLDAAPLFRIVHCKLEDEDRVVIVCHHLIADGQSVSLLAERIVSLARGVADPRLSIAVDAGFDAYQRKQAVAPSDKRAARHQRYWHENLARQEAPDLSHWMHPGDTAEDGIGREIRLPLDPALRQAISECAKEVEVSEYTLYLATFGLLLGRYAQTDHVSVATPFADRPGIEMEQSIGCFIKTLPVHLDVQARQTMRAMFERVSAEIVGSWKHLGHPLAQLLGEYPALGRVYDVTFIHDSYPDYPEGVLGTVRQDPVHFPGKLTVLVELIGDRSELVFQYKESALTAEKATRFAHRYLALLEQVPGSLDALVADVAAPLDAESEALLASLDESHFYDWHPRHLGEVVLEKTAGDPARVAWTDETREYTNAWAHDAAVLVQRRLLDALDQRGRPVAVLLPRSANLLAALFGTMLAGSAYVPLSHGMPAQRTAQIFGDAGIAAVLTTSDADIELPEGVTRLNLDHWEEFSRLRSGRIIGEIPAAVDRGPDDVLYIEYTSGSTGQPKGVVVTHANVQNTAMDLERRFPLGRNDVYLLKTAFTFDIFGTEVYGWLFGEGRLAILPVGHEGDAPAVIDAVREQHVTHLNCSPTMLRVILDAAEGRTADLDPLRYVFSGGEALTADIVERFFSLRLRCSLENVYGPTEATMWATHGTVTAEDTSAVAPIGKPLNDYRILILDREGRRCGVDAPGEVCIAGAGVAVGYLNRDELNAAQFVENPYYDPETDPPHLRRMYRTGDLGYLRADGRFAFIRRIDRQVKVGGVRMELGEVEQALLRAEGVVEAAALVDDAGPAPRLAGFFTAREGVTVESVREALAQTLMSNMIPSPLVKLEALPTSAAGKLDRRALKELLPRGGAAQVTAAASPVQERVAELWRRVLGLAEVDAEASFFEQGGNSLSLMSLQQELREEFGREIRITELLKHHNVTAQARLLGDAAPEAAEARVHAKRAGDIAIIGIGLQVPGAGDVQEFWANLREGAESITFYEDEELRALGVSESDLRDPSYVKAKGRLADVNVFDDALFPIAPAEVDVTSPQLRLLYKCFWQACEDAGYDPRALPGRVGVFTGGNDDFAWYQKALLEASGFGDAYQNFTLATNHFLSTRLSYLFDLKGPSMSSLSGCSTSLLTVHQAVQSLRAGECDMAVAGGATLELPNEGGYRYVDGMMLSPDGHCRPFDADAGGTVFSNGAALLVLKPVEAALRDGDPVYAVVKGSAVGNDGGNKPSFTAPSEDGQYETIRAAYESSGIDPASVTYVEAHGTGTLLGDPIEVASLSRVFKDSPNGACLLGSVKGNVGHTDSAAGSVGLSKVALSLKHRYVPGTRGYENPNPAADFDATPFRVSGDGQVWRGELLRAGVNSFGVGGTNVHMIVEEAPNLGPTEDGPFELLQFSAATPEALERTSERVVRHLAGADVSLSDAALTLRAGRAELPHRKTIVAARGEDRDAWTARLAAAATAEADPEAAEARTALLFSGQGNQHHRMGLGLYRSESEAGAVYRHWMDQLIGYLADDEAAEFRDLLYGEDEDDNRVHRTEWSQFALFSTQYAMAKVLESYGVRPDLLIGHSIGELTAAALAGVWSLEDAARLVRERGKLMQAQRPGVMIAVTAPAERVREAIRGLPDVWVSLDNSAERAVLGMAKEAFDAVVDRLEEQGVRGSRLHTSHAFHTPMMNGAAEAFAAVLSTVDAKDPSIPIVSNRTGRIVRPGEMTDPAYWSEHITDEVRFTESLRTLLSGEPLFGIELGPGRSLTTFAQHDPQRTAGQVFVNVLRHAMETVEDEAHLLNALGTLWSAGMPLDWSRHGRGRRVSLPGYAFDPVPHPQDFAISAEPAPAKEQRVTTVAAGADALQGIREAFRHVLGYEEVAPDDDFFALGGDSLKATGLSAHLASQVGIEVTVADIFASPTPAALAERFRDQAATGGLQKAPHADHHPLSPAQTRMYIAAKMDPGRLIYNMPSATLLQGSLDPERVRTAVRRLVERHEPLRTTFALRDGEIRQRTAAFSADAEPPLQFTSGDHIGEDAVNALLERFVRPFDLEHGPLFRMEIVDGGPEGSLLLFDIHHIIADAVSAEVLSRDFSELYVGELEPLPLQYTDYVHHVQERESSEELAQSESHLLAALADAPTRDLLAPDHPRGLREAAAGRVALHFGPDRIEAVKALAEAHNATPFMVMLSAWGAVFSRYAESEDLVIGAPVTGRTLTETREMVGMFVNMMPIRLRPRAEATFGDYLDGSRASVLDGLTHQDVPFDRLVEKLHLERTPGRHPLFDISFDYHNMDHHEVRIDGITAHQLDLMPLAVGMDLVITCTEARDGLTVHIDYAADLFDRSTIDGLAGHFDVLLDRVCADDSLPLAGIALYSDAQHEAMAPKPVEAPFTPIHELIAGVAAASPEAVAVIDGDGERYTFAELDGLANVQAARLREAGLRTGEPVALFTVRDVNLLIAQLAILKAGGAYVPLDPTQPEARHEAILADVKPRFGFAPKGLASASRLPAVVDIGTCKDESPTGFDAPAVGPDDPIYLVYTSGSTGVPKGIAVRHRGVLNLFRDHRERALFGPGDTIISLADPTFDIFAFESLIPLASGACVHMCPTEDQKDAAAIAARIADCGVTHIQTPVSKMAALYGNRRFRSQLHLLRVVVCGGEHFPESLLQQLQAETRARIFNMYGPTETTVTATVKELGPGEAVTIGSAVSGAAVLVVGEHGMLQPDGVPGEICIAGEGLGLGYTNNPEENRRAFTTIAELPGVPVYRTSDVGVRLANGEIVLKGRLDHQVKVNGNRIELGEIEKTAMRADGVSYAVAAVEDGDLVLYYTARTETDLAEPIRARLAEALPVYMRPGRYHRLKEMPKLHNNKVDRKALRSPERAPEAAPEPVAPFASLPAAAPSVSVVLEGVLLAWEAVLGTPVRPTDNFFDVGGNSYKLMLVNNRLDTTLGLEVPLVKLFENPTPQSLAEALGEPGTAAAPAETGAEAISLEDITGAWAVEERPADERKIAVIGMAGVLPGASGIAEHWANRAEGVVSVSRFTREELLAAGVDESTVDDPRYVSARGFVDAGTFDADFFRYSAKDAEALDPQARLLHETTWHALEDAGYVPEEYSGDIGLFVGSGTNFAWMAGFLDRKDDPIGAFEAMTLNEKDFLATRIAYKLDLTGPAVNVQTACSTSLVAIHEAVRCLRQGGADMALAGGVALNFPRKEGYAWHEGMIFSKDGVCRPFDQGADGTVAGQGCGVVLLKPLDKAIEDGDHVYAVIAGSAANNDGNRKVGYTAPSAQGQKEVIRAALADAGVNADDIGYVETHGTGTGLGDPIEYGALSAVYGKGGPCAIGAVKANIGHLDAAAGVAGFIGAVGVLSRGEIPPMANFDSMNEAIEASGSLYVPTGPVAPEAGVRMAAVSSFGIGGTNAHLILEAAPPQQEPPQEDAGEHLFPVSARTERSRLRMQEALDGLSGVSARDVSHTLARGRAEFDSRAVAISAAGRPLEWIEPAAPPLAWEASDRTRMSVSRTLADDASAAATGFRETVERELQVFDAQLRGALWKAVFEAPASEPAIERISQFVIRLALIRVAGVESLHAPAGSDRLVRIAQAFALGGIGAGEAMKALKSGAVPTGLPERTGPEPTIMDGPVEARLLRRVLASRWVHRGEVDRTLFCTNGKRIPLPGYAFEERRFVSDIRLSDLGPVGKAGTAVDDDAPRQTAGSSDDVLRETWTELLGTAPGPDDDFLQSGGDSLTAVHLCALVEKRAGLALTVGEVFADARYDAIRALLAGKRVNSPVKTQAAVAVQATSPGTSPASPAQKRMYAVCALQNDTTAYNLAIAYKVTGELDAERLRSVLRRLAERHDQLRTGFHLEGGELVQRVRPEVPDLLSVIELTEAEARARLAAEPRPFDLAAAPLMRVEALSVDGEIRYLLIDMHHIIGDQTSLAILADDLALALADEPLAPAPMRYADYAEALAALEDSGEFAEDVAFFTSMLADDLPKLELPTDKTPAGTATFDGDRRSLVLAADRRTVADLARRCGATPYMVFVAGLTRLLGLYSGQREFVIGTAVSGRSLPGTDRTVGMFANTLPLKVTDDASRTVAEAIGGARDDALAVLGHQNAPFEAVLSELDLHPGGETHPLFDVLFNYVSTGTEELELDGVRLDALPPGRMKSRYALSFSVAEREDDFSIDIEYRTELFEDETIARLAGHLDRLLLTMAEDADRKVSGLRLEPDEEHERRRAALTAAGPAIEESLLERTVASFARHADFPALRWDRAEWSYADLDRITDELAGGLQAAGVGVGDFVLCLLDRGPWQVFTRVALMKCGAVEIPLDAKTPADRIAQTLEDSGAKTVLCNDIEAHPWPEDVAAHRPDLVHGDYEAPGGVTAQSPLIMIYTSGTTGQPKGTLVPHGGVLSTCADNGYMDYAPGERILHLTGYTFDPSLLDIYSAFLAGATLVMGRHDLNMDVKLLADFLRNERIDKGILITAVFHLLMAEHPGAIAGMSALYVGGEAMQPWAAERAFEVLGAGGLYNLYGPTEASVCTTYFRVDEAPAFQRMPIGVPARGRELFIVHPDGTDVPRGVPGELCVAGPSVAIGYHRRPELTAEKFTDDLGDLPERVYRTGDRVVLDDAGRIVYIDRIDQQVKHAGYRIELSEIELVLQGCAGVVEAVVIHTNERNDSRLTAFYTGESAPAEAELRQFLLGKLPRYMVPQRLNRMRELPLTSHGKVDRKLLAANLEPAQAQPAPVAVPVHAAGANPEVLAAFREVLGVPDLSDTDDFFLAGAQSLQAIAVIRRLRESGVDVEVGDLYRHPTAAGLSVVLRPAPAVAPQEPRELKTLPGEQLRRMVDWAVEDGRRVAAAFAAEAPAYRFDIGAVARLHRATGAETGGLIQTVAGLEAADVQEAVAKLAARHEVLRTRFDGDRFEVLEPEAFAQLSTLVPVQDLRRIDRDQVREFTDALAYGLQAGPFTDGLLWRCVIVQETDDALRLVWAFHHGIFDGFSAGLLRSELPRLARGERLPEPERYSDFLRSVESDQDWRSELDAFDYAAWLDANRTVTAAFATAPPANRLSVPLEGEHPLKAALKTVHAQLSALTGLQQIAVGLVTDCRRWKDEDYADCVGEFLDVVPVLLQGDGDQPIVADRIADAQDRGVHFVHTLFGGPEREDLPKELRAAYRNDRGRLDLALVNFQGHIDPADVPEEAGDADGDSLATAHVNVWHDDEALHLEWVATDSSTREPQGDPR